MIKIEKIPTSKINPAPYNPRKNLQPDDPEYKKLLRSIDEFDCVQPLVWNHRTGNLVGGHQRLKILIARKAAYRLLHPSGHRIRFRHDNDVFYFERAPSIMKHLWPKSMKVFPKLIEFTNMVAKCLQGPVSPFDLFRAKFKSMASRRPYYVDMFPE